MKERLCLWHGHVSQLLFRWCVCACLGHKHELSRRPRVSPIQPVWMCHFLHCISVQDPFYGSIQLSSRLSLRLPCLRRQGWLSVRVALFDERYPPSLKTTPFTSCYSLSRLFEQAKVPIHLQLYHRAFRKSRNYLQALAFCWFFQTRRNSKARLQFSIQA